MANKITDTKYYSAIADAIRAKNGSSDTYYPADMAQAIEDIPSGGIPQALLDLMAGTASGEVEITLPEYAYAVTIAIGNDNSYIRRNNNAVTGLTVKGVKHWGNTNMNTPGNGGYFSAGNNANLKYIRLPDCEEMQITKQNMYVNAFQNLTEFTAPNLVTLQGTVRKFSGNNIASKIKQFVCPKLTSTLADSDFYYCPDLVLVDIKSNSITNNVFNSDRSLVALVLRANPTATTLTSTGALAATPIASGTGYIYVPRDLVATYQAATNWSTYSAQFRALEDYTDDGTLTGEFIMPTA